ncbi:MAG: class I SAM-dependent methyltransferase [Thiotrichales bacterium]|nr:class I SAM-dependent methyltransferase [Thiotrichales bacterium]
MARRHAPRKRKETMASKADVHALYQQAVQCVEAEIDFVDETFANLRRRKARRLREDFCGTAHAACEWIRRRRTNRAVAVDIDTDVLEWGRRHNVVPLGRSAWRIELVHADVLDVDRGGMDAVLAMNFSYWVLHTRAELRRYFERVRDALVEDGVFFLDAYGGYHAFREMQETTENDGFTYVWDQAWYDPITGRNRCRIHFRFPDGSGIRDAFVYEWRLWTLPEIREVLEEAGFRDVTVYWQGTDEKTGEGNGEFTPAEHGDADAGWITYVTALK